METVYIAGGCLWGVQAFIKTLPGVLSTEAGRANGISETLSDKYDGYAECVKTSFDPMQTSITDLMNYLFEIIDPYSINKKGVDEGPKYRTGIYSDEQKHLEEARDFISKRPDKERIAVEVLPLNNYVASAEEHQDRLDKHPEDISYCHVTLEMLKKYL
ncbi:peptide-methionine (S)-S-oxide reductase [Staphylococcus haemolyticus]|uniref:peptide-methionine (S)-S-oxide reductase n=1 Tax=Staphylococcus haemolyticus TaxID=1283 RepID=UPI002557948C|nr:peptide-methionine (S)-S-oxide reductase [Staphylococcus haemolyticus]